MCFGFGLVRFGEVDAKRSLLEGKCYELNVTNWLLMAAMPICVDREVRGIWTCLPAGSRGVSFLLFVPASLPEWHCEVYGRWAGMG